MNLYIKVVILSLLVYFKIDLIYPQQIKPIAYIGFDSSDWQEKESDLEWVDRHKKSEWIQTGGVRGGYLKFLKESKGSLSTLFNIKGAFTVECWIRFSDPSFNEENLLFSFRDQSFKIGFNYPRLNFQTITTLDDGSKKTDQFFIDFYGAGVSTFNHFMDREWHHLVFKFDANSGQKECWIDGLSPSSFSKQLTYQGSFCPESSCEKQLHINHNKLYGFNYVGDIDELIIYDSFIPSNIHVQHYLAGKKGEPYLFQGESSILSFSNPVVKEEIDRKEFPPNHPNVNINAISQLTGFPLPRYKPGNSLIRNYNWFYMLYFGGFHLEEVSDEEVLKNRYLIQEELITNWNYLLQLGAKRITPQINNVSELYVNDPRLALAMKYKEIPYSITTHWGSVYHYDKETSKAEKAYIARQDLPEEYYLKVTDKKLLEANKIYQKRNWISPEAPLTLMKKDGKVQAENVIGLIDLLGRNPRVINENGEMPFYPTKIEILASDNTISKRIEQIDKVDWKEYQSRKKLEQRSAYRDPILSRVKEKGEVIYSWYAVSGGRKLSWKESREIMTPINGQYYSTYSFYPKWPDNWRIGRGAWNGFRKLEKGRKEEILAGDKLFSPFIAAGWDRDPEKNIRPSQWLGMLKCLGVLGAEFYYVGHFHQGNHEQRKSLPRNFVWQAAVPSYAQAITSRYEEMLRNGALLKDNDGIPITRHNVGDPSIVLCVRKHLQKEQYIIAGTIQPVSNIKGNVPDQKKVSFNIGNTALSTTIRRQGSVYFLDLENVNHPIFYQLDTWHEEGHPGWWSKDIKMEAEVYDQAENIQINTEIENISSALDFTSYTSYIQGIENKRSSVDYFFSDRKVNSRAYRINIKARSQTGKKGSIDLFLDGEMIGKFKKVRGKDWKWYVLNVKKDGRYDIDFQKTTHKFTVNLNHSAIQLEKVDIEIK